ncbi:MAG: P-loop NTPase [candidate division Zixibacteria bacterium]
MVENKKPRRSFREVPRGLARVNHIIAIGSGKGGVGKSTVSTNFAMALKKTGYKVGLMDADIYGPSQPEMLGVGKQQPQVKGDYLLPLEKHGLVFMSLGLLLDDSQPVIWRGPMASKMIQQFLGNVLWGDLDYLIIDLPPGSGDVQITLTQQAPLSGVIIVTTPQHVALGVAQKGLQMFRHVNVPILGIIENMSGFTCPKCGEKTDIFKQGGGRKLAEDLDINFLGGIPLDPELMASGDNGTPLLLNTADSPAAKEFINIASKFIDIMAKGIEANEPEKIEITDDGNLSFTWPDGHIAEFTPSDLRANCGCALCVSEDTGQKTLDIKSIPLDIKIGAFERIGRYAVSIAFSDGHNTGIYRFDKMHQMEIKQKDASDKAFNV